MNTDQPKPTGEQPIMRNPLTGKDVYASDMHQYTGEPKPTGEWTKEYVHELMRGIGADARIADAHNAQIALAYKKGHDDGYAEAGNGLGY